MASINKQQLIDTLEQRVEQHLNDAVKIFQNLDEKHLLQPASNGGWSIAQCLWHLNRYGDFYLPEIKKALAKEKGDPSKEKFKGSWIGSYFARMMDPETGKRRIKAFKDFTPERELDAHAEVAEYIQQQETLLQYLGKARNKDLDAVKLPISITNFIKLKLGDVFQFLIAHDERHIQQAKRNL